MARRKKKQDWTPRESQPGDQPISKKFIDSYLETAIWASTDGDGHPLDRDYDVRDFSQEAIDQAIQETNDFITGNATDLDAVGDMESHGHDFWLTRNGHGTGFFDRGYGEVGTHLTRAAKTYGEVVVYIGADAMLHFAP